jgi:VIT1/CCC1 family predicted Fe2+/Mn2+ transporter
VELDDELESVTTPEQRQHLYRWMLGVLPRATTVPARVTAADMLSALAVALVVLVATVPVIAPFLFMDDVDRAVRLANFIATGLLFLLGYRWAQHTGGRPIAVGLAVAAFGLIMVLVTLLLGG